MGRGHISPLDASWGRLISRLTDCNILSRIKDCTYVIRRGLQTFSVDLKTDIRDPTRVLSFSIFYSPLNMSWNCNSRLKGYQSVIRRESQASKVRVDETLFGRRLSMQSAEGVVNLVKLTFSTPIDKHQLCRSAIMYHALPNAGVASRTAEVPIVFYL